jgi:hypothetical protein
LSDNTLTALSKFPPLHSFFGDYKTNPAIRSVFNQKINTIKTEFPLLGFIDDNGVKHGFLCGEGIWRWKLYDFLQNQNNFNVVDRVEAYTSASYFLGIGGNKKDGLISEAKAKLSSKANLIGKPKALANEVVDIKTQIIFGIITRYTVTVSADVVEFK